jgi:lincosamide nucleotidyltransferase A/C/D/E
MPSNPQRTRVLAEVDWLPVRIELRAPGIRWVDVHPVHFDGSGAGRQAGLNGMHFDYPPEAFTAGTLNGRLIGCLSIQQQFDFHTGYEHQAKDKHDLAELNALDHGSLPGPT